MDDLVARLRARLDTDERVALAALDHTLNDIGECPGLTEPCEPLRLHAYRHDPARVLRWVKAAREILRRHEPIRVLDGWACDDSFISAEGGQYEEWPCPDVRALMSVYGDEAG